MKYIEMIEIADSISIYTKYLTDESIYEKDDIGRKNIFTLANTQYDNFDLIDYGYLENNFWYDISIPKMYLPDNALINNKLENIEKLKENVINEAYLKVEEYKKVAQNNPDSFYILILKPNINIYFDAYQNDKEWIYVRSNMAMTEIRESLYVMPIEIYNNTYKDKIIAAYRYKYFVMSDGVQIIPESGDGVIYTEKTDGMVYDYVKNVRLTKLADIFYDDSNYVEVIEKHIKDCLKYMYNYNDEEIRNLIQNMKYDLIGSHIEVTIPEIENFKREISFYEFSKEMIKVFDE